ncbi:B3 domain-containing protein REM5-like [Macadamia integrifolia]|uniref:B3 domain-containing protein REM5-like n=1 Tax=Macadamia integrifolia TaxID=60698 RepID=UPI001C4F0132|nr:B3 domain-containing protein REM5-like [Macadamia integrifolia]
MVITKIRPRNPQFFKVILNGSFQLAIPIEFRKYLRDEKCEEGEAVLRNSGKSWRVKVNGFCFKEGWADFARDCHLHIGDFVVFKHEGGLVFDVSVFDRSACEKEYQPLLHPQNETKREAGMFESRGKEPILEKKINKSKGSASTHSGALKAAVKEYAASCKFEDPFFVVPMRKFNLTKYTLCIPKDFAKSNGLTGKSFEVILKDQGGNGGRSWSVQLKQEIDGRVNLASGWNAFAVANRLKEDQLCIFKLLHEDGKLVFDVTVVDYKPSGRKFPPPAADVSSKD